MNKKYITSFDELLKLKPEGTRAIIIAELDQDESDSQIDYFAHSVIREVAIGWRTGRRENVKLLRQAADSFPETKHLGLEAPDNIEHREIRHGFTHFYLKNGWNHANGWRVQSYNILDFEHLDFKLENHLPIVKEETKFGSITVTHNHLRAGIEIHFPNKPEQNIIDQLKIMKYRWSKYNHCWYTGYTQEKIEEAKEYIKSLSEIKHGI